MLFWDVIYYFLLFCPCNWRCAFCVSTSVIIITIIIVIINNWFELPFLGLDNKCALVRCHSILTIFDPDSIPFLEVPCIWCMLHVCIACSVLDVGSFWKVLAPTTACFLLDATLVYHQRWCESRLTLWNTLYRTQLTLSELSHGGCSCDVVWSPFRFHGDE